jgi:hypothetical protein
LAAAVAIMGWANGDPYKLRYRGMCYYYGEEPSMDSHITKLLPDQKRERTDRARWKIRSSGWPAYHRGSKEYDSGMEALRKGNSGAAIAHFEEACCAFGESLNEDPDHILANTNLVNSLIEILKLTGPESPDPNPALFEDSLSEATETLGRLTDEAGGNYSPVFVFLQGLVNYIGRDYPAAIKAFEHALKKDSFDIRARAYLANALEKCDEEDRGQDERQRAAQDLEELVTLGLFEVGPQEFDHRDYRRGIEASRQGRHKDAIDAFIVALKGSPDRVPGGAHEAHTGLLSDDRVLERWRRAVTSSPQPPADAKPKLVVVTVSGGGIVAACWAAMCLTEIEKNCPVFPYHVRLITGASGGMVGAGQYVATLRKPGLDGDRRSEEELDRIVRAVTADSLTPVIRRLVFGDLPSIFSPSGRGSDRGQKLEQSWEDAARREGLNGAGIAQRFRDLNPGELEGWRP